MAYQLLPNIILLLSILGVFVLVLRRLPEASDLDEREASAHAVPQARLLAKGLPARAASRSRAAVTIGVKRVWHFMLEAKGLRQGPAVNYKIRKIWRRQPIGPVHDEAYYLAQIKRAPKDLEHYNQLGQYYLDRAEFEEARNVYDYLTKHSPVNGDYFAKLGYCCLQLGQMEKAISSYQKSLSLDPSHPNRYYNLALAFKTAKKPTEAVEAIEQALSLEPHNSKYQQMAAELKSQIDLPL